MKLFPLFRECEFLVVLALVIGSSEVGRVNGQEKDDQKQRAAAEEKYDSETKALSSLVESTDDPCWRAIHVEFRMSLGI